MKKLIAAAMAAMMIGTAALAADIAPKETIDMNNLNDGSLTVSIDAENVDDNAVTVKIYKHMTYTKADVDQLAIGDVIQCSEGDVKIETIERPDENTVDINGGFENNGITLCYDAETDEYGEMDFEYTAVQEAGEALLKYADRVEFNVYRMDDDFSIAGEGYNTETVSAKEAAAKLNELIEKFSGLSAYQTTVRVEDGNLAEVTVDYMP